MSLKDTNPLAPHHSKNIAIVIANSAISTSTGWPVGFWWSELTHPYHAFTDVGYRVEIFSPTGGSCVADAMSDPNDASGYSKADLISQGFIHTPELMALVANTRKAADIDVTAFDAIVVAGGQAPMFNFEQATDLHTKFAEFHNTGKVAAALCHGVAILAYAKDLQGQHIAKGKTVTGFANVEEDFADNAIWNYNMLPRGTHIMPWRIEDRMRELGANYVQSGLWRSFAVRDGNLITGQQNFSGAETAALVIEALGR